MSADLKTVRELVQTLRKATRLIEGLRLFALTYAEDKGIGLKGWLTGPKSKSTTAEKKPEQTTLDRHRIAILPFSNISPDPKEEYFADGMTEELISTLSMVSNLRVIARTSVMKYKGTNKGIGEIAQELKTGTLLEGSLRKVENRLRATVQLIDAVTEEHIWAQSYDREIKDVFAIQSDIAHNIAQALKVRLLEDEKERIKKVPTRDMEAYVLYLGGRSHEIRGGPVALDLAIKNYLEAVEKEPRYALAYAGLSRCYSSLRFRGQLSSAEALPKQKEFAKRAMELDDSVAEGHLAMASVLRNEWDWTGAEKEIKKTIELNPNLAQARNQYALLLLFMGRLEEMVSEVERALQLDPISPETSSYAGTMYLYSRDYDMAIQHLRNALEIDPGIGVAKSNLGVAYVCKGRIDEGIIEIKKADAISEGKDGAILADLAWAYSKAGNVDEARKTLAKLIKTGKQRSGVTTAIAAIYSILGERDKAFEWLERAYDEHSILPNINAEYWFDNIRSDQRFNTLLKKIGLK